MKEEQKKEKDKKRRISKIAENSEFSKFTSTGTVNFGKYGRKGGNNINVRNLLAGELENIKKPSIKKGKNNVNGMFDFDNLKTVKGKKQDD